MPSIQRRARDFAPATLIYYAVIPHDGKCPPPMSVNASEATGLRISFVSMRCRIKQHAHVHNRISHPSRAKKEFRCDAALSFITMITATVHACITETPWLFRRLLGRGPLISASLVSGERLLRVPTDRVSKNEPSTEHAVYCKMPFVKNVD
jgi:hypothetical protein